MAPGAATLPLVATFIVYAFCVEEVGLWCTTHEILYRDARAWYWPLVSIPAGVCGVLLYVLVCAAAYDYGIATGVVLTLACLATVVVNTVYMQKLRFELKLKIWPILLTLLYLDSALLASRLTWFGLRG
ncbi:MAG: hypothetical protein KGM42_17900 [Hyphomicrobiales bacterium]|nr:hypothetical protein [Hyphomicrobiales bacterium]